MITVHDRAARVFTATGLGVLDREVIDPVVSEELGGEYVLSFQYPANASAAAHLVLENIIACPVPGMEARQGFRIHEVVTTLGGLLEVSAFHVFYDLAANLVADTFVVNKTAKAALDQILTAATTPHSFTATSSDTTTRASARIVRMPLAQALMDSGEDNSFATRWGGELVRDNWQIHHGVRRGLDRGVVIRDRKNLTGYQASIDFSTVVTRVLPVGYDGLLLPELYVDSPRLDDYAIPRIKVVRYGQVKAVKDPAKPREDELPLAEAYQELRRLAALEYSAGRVDEPSASYKVSFVDLATTREYADLAQLETVALGDAVTVRHDDLGVALTARVVGYEYNPLSSQYVSVELGSTAAKFTSVTRDIKTAVSRAEAASDVAGFALASADGKNTNHYGTTQPAEASLGDTWFKQNGENTEIWIYQLTDTGTPGWVAVATDLNHAQVQAELDVARAEIEAAKQASDQATTAANQAANAVAAAQGDIDAAREASADAVSKAEAAQAAADKVTDGLAAAQASIDAAREASADAEQKAKEAKTIANTVASKLDVAQAELDKAQKAVTQVAGDTAAARRRADEAFTLAGTKLDQDQVADLVQASAGGKNQITLSTTTPSGAGARPGDTWWQREGSKLIGQWTWDGSKWLATTLNHHIISSVDVHSLLVTGTARINQAVVSKIIADAGYFGVLAANRVVVGDGTNLWPDPTLVLDYPGWSKSASGRLSRSGSGVQAGSYYDWSEIVVRPGEAFVGSFQFTRTDTGQKITLHAQRHAASTGKWQWAGHVAQAGTGTTTTTPNAFVVPADTDRIRFGLFLEKHTKTGAKVQVWDVQVRRQTPAVLIEDGAITTDKLAANSITASKIQAGAVTSDKLTIANGYITNAMIKNAAISNAKIGSLSAGKITTGYLAAARIAAGSITSDKLTIANGYITTAMIANAAITDAKIGSLSAGKITTGYLAAARIAAGSITSDKLTIANGFITTAMIKDAAITDAKIGNLSATKITSGYLAAARIAAGSITSDKLTIANGYIQTAMIANAAITSAKIASLDAGKINTGYLSAYRIRAGSISADKLAANAIQVGLAGWTQSIRISPIQVAWYNGSTLEGTITATGMNFWYGTRYLGKMGHSYKNGSTSVRGITNQLDTAGDFITWSYKKNSSDTSYTTMLTMDPKGLFYTTAGLHFGMNLRLNGYKLYTSNNRYITLQDCTLTGKGTYAGWASSNSLAKVVFHTYDLMIVTNGSYYNMTRLFERVGELMGRVNTLISLLNQGWVKNITGQGSNIQWNYYTNTGLATMPTTLA